MIKVYIDGESFMLKELYDKGKFLYKGVPILVDDQFDFTVIDAFFNDGRVFMTPGLRDGNIVILRSGMTGVVIGEDIVFPTENTLIEIDKFDIPFHRSDSALDIVTIKKLNHEGVFATIFRMEA